MSHWTRCQTVIKDLSLLEKAAKKLGVKVTRGKDLKLESIYQESQDAVMLMKHKDGQAGIVKTKSGYEMVVDNFYNPVTDLLGNDCTLLGREYSKLLVEQQAMMMGGMVTHSTITENGSVEMTITL